MKGQATIQLPAPGFDTKYRVDKLEQYEPRKWERPRLGEFSCNNAWNLLLAASAAYFWAPTVRYFLEEWGFINDDKGDFLWAEQENDCGFVASDGVHALVVTRGSDGFDLPDWGDNLNFPPIRDHMGMVHRGFQKATDRLYPFFRGEALGIITKARYVFITGHSRGAAIATMVASRLRAMGFQLDGLYVFGSPRTGNWRFANNLNSAMRGLIHRVENEGDLITTVPPVVPYGYEHVGELALLQETQLMRTQTEFAEAARLASRRGSRISAPQTADLFEPHYPETYLKRLKAFCSTSGTRSAKRGSESAQD